MYFTTSEINDYYYLQQYCTEYHRNLYFVGVKFLCNLFEKEKWPLNLAERPNCTWTISLALTLDNCCLPKIPPPCLIPSKLPWTVDSYHQGKPPSRFFFCNWLVDHARFRPTLSIRPKMEKQKVPKLTKVCKIMHSWKLLQFVLSLFLTLKYCEKIYLLNLK